MNYKKKHDFVLWLGQVLEQLWPHKSYGVYF